VWLRVWAPRASTLEVLVGEARRVPLAAQAGADGWYSGEVPGLGHGVDYQLVLDGSEPVPDPRARWLRWGVHGPSRVWDPGSHHWSDQEWPGRELADRGVIYELHVGTFTTAGTLDSAAAHLSWLVDLGITHVELMPVAGFDGRWGWGYDPVALDAVHEPYGGPEALCRFVDAAHAYGLAVLLDVVHNHLGPSGANWQRFGPFLSDAHHTPWGEAVNLDGPGSDDVRAILLSSAAGWITDFHLDGLRVDAVHAFRDDRALTYLEELATTVDSLAVRLGRPLTLIAESDRNDPRTVVPRSNWGIGVTAQWDDDVHHALHWLLTGEDSGYYADFASTEAVASTLERGFRHEGRWSSFRGRTHGRPIDWNAVDPWRFVVALQTHDQVGNRAGGERLAGLVGADRLAAGAAILLSLPYTPMLFMGEEWAAGSPWMYFTAFTDPDLGNAVTHGRQHELAEQGWQPEDVPDPQVPHTFAASKLDWDETSDADPHSEHHELAGWYRSLIELRATEPDLGPAQAGPAATPGGISCVFEDSPRGSPDWFAVRRGPWRVVVNLSDQPVRVDLGEPSTSGELAEPAESADSAEPGEPGTVIVRDWRARGRIDEGVLCLAPGGACVVRTDQVPWTPAG
jgi:maltooligosyltrehalose trehalohydrolase